LFIRRFSNFVKMDNKLKCLLFEAYFTLAWARYWKSRDFSKVAAILGKQMSETPYFVNGNNRIILRNISSAMHMASKYAFWESECLVKAIAGMKMLERRGIDSTIYLGTAKDVTGLIAHAWLRSGTYYLSGKEGMEKFTVVATFANDLTSINRKGERYG